MSEGVVARALPLWGLAGADATLIAARENAVYRITLGDRRHAMRLHREGYRSDAELASELDWMAAMARAGIHVPAPVPSREGALLHSIDGVQVNLLSWVRGDTLDSLLPTATPDARRALYHGLGVEMARLHDACAAWETPAGFTRCAWDREGLLGENPLWGRFWDNPELTPEDAALFEKFRAVANAALRQHGDALDYGLIHGDLVAANVMIDRDRIQLIDFDDGGFGYRAFEVATALLKLEHAPDYPALEAALLDGYQSIRSLETAALPLFFALRAASYVGWNITRMHEDKTKARNSRFIAQARAAIERYLATA